MAEAKTPDRALDPLGKISGGAAFEVVDGLGDAVLQLSNGSLVVGELQKVLPARRPAALAA